MIFSSLLFIVYFLLVSVPGWVIVQRMSRGEKDLLVLVPVSISVGVSLFLCLLNLALYLVPFSLCNRVLLPLYPAAVLFFAKKEMFLFSDYRWDLDRSERRSFLLVFGAVMALQVLYIAGTFYADSFWHASLSMTILNGNYHPLKFPWYPDYHYAFHYAYALHKASIQDFCNINQFYSDKPWYLIFVASMFTFLTGFVKKSFGNNFRAGLAAAVCFLFFSGFAFIATFEKAFHILQSARSLPSKEVYEMVIELFKTPPYDHTAFCFFDAAMHKSSLMKYVVFFPFVYLLVRGQRRDSSTFLYMIVSGMLLGFLCLCEESMFPMACAGVGCFFLFEFIRAKRGDGLRVVGIGITILAIGAFLAVFQGGYLTTSLFHAHEQYPPSSPAQLGQFYRKLIFRDGFYFAAHPVFTLDFNTWRILAVNYALPLFCFVALQWKVFRNRDRYAGETVTTFLVWCSTFWAGFLAAGLVTLVPADTLMNRMYLWVLLCLSSGVYLILLIESKWKHKLGDRSMVRLEVFVVLLLICASLIRLSCGIALSAAFQLSNEKKQMQKSVAFGQWLKNTIPSDARTFGAEPRYTGHFSYGGNPARDSVVFSNSELEAYQRAKATVDYDFLRRNKITHVIVESEKWLGNQETLSDTNKFVEIPGPFSGEWRVYRVRSPADQPEERH